MSGNTEFPSADHLEELREQGVVPYSAFATALMSVAGAILAFLSFKTSLYKDFNTLVTQIAELEFDKLASSEKFMQALFSLEMFGVAVIVGAVALSLFAGLIQTRFLISGDALGFNLTRLLPEVSNLGYVFGRVWRIFIVTVIGLIFAGVAFYLHIPRVLPLLNLDRSSILASVGEMINNEVGAVIAVLFGLAFTSWLVSRFLFMYQHRMAKDDSSPFREGSS